MAALVGIDLGATLAVVMILKRLSAAVSRPLGQIADIADVLGAGVAES